MPTELTDIFPDPDVSWFGSCKIEVESLMKAPILVCFCRAFLVQTLDLLFGGFFGFF